MAEFESRQFSLVSSQALPCIVINICATPVQLINVNMLHWTRPSSDEGCTVLGADSSLANAAVFLENTPVLC